MSLIDSGPGGPNRCRNRQDERSWSRGLAYKVPMAAAGVALELPAELEAIGTEAAARQRHQHKRLAGPDVINDARRVGTSRATLVGLDMACLWDSEGEMRCSGYPIPRSVHSSWRPCYASWSRRLVQASRRRRLRDQGAVAEPARQSTYGVARGLFRGNGSWTWTRHSRGKRVWCGRGRRGAGHRGMQRADRLDQSRASPRYGESSRGRSGH